MDSKKSTAAKFDREIAATHPRAEWTRGYIPTASRLRADAFRPFAGQLYSAWQNKATGEVHYLHGRTLRTASAPLVRRFRKSS